MAEQPNQWDENVALENLMSKLEQSNPELATIIRINTKLNARLSGSEGEFRNRQEDNLMARSRAQEAGATERARIQSGSSKYGADVSARNARLASTTQRYGYDLSRLTDQEKIALDRELGTAKLGIDRDRLGLDKDKLGLERTLGLGRLGLERELGIGKLDLERDLGQGKLGLDYLSTASQLRGPENYLQQADFLRGASARQDVPVFVQSLMSGVNAPQFVGVGGAPQGANISNLMSRLTGNNTQGAQQDASFLQGVRDMAQRGFHRLAPGSLESLRPAELATLKSALEYGGDGGQAYSWDDLMSVYGSSRIGQSDPRVA